MLGGASGRYGTPNLVTRGWSDAGALVVVLHTRWDASDSLPHLAASTTKNLEMLEDHTADITVAHRLMRKAPLVAFSAAEGDAG